VLLSYADRATLSGAKCKRVPNALIWPPMKISDLPHFERFRNTRDVKVLRHKDSRQDLWKLHDEGKFDDYQNGQSWDVFGSARFVISFIAERNRYAKFVGVWEVLSKRKKKSKGYAYQTKSVAGFEDLRSRLIVRWGEGTRSWAQWLHRQGDKEVIEMLPPNYVMAFPGYYKFMLSYDQLSKMVNNPDSNREWERMLASVSGVYIILDQRSGRQYVGSAYGNGGIWARWRSYARSPSGGNVLLKKLLAKNPDRYRQFQFSILRVLEPDVPKDEVIEQESLAKRKLGSRAFGLNDN
jgi:hypothetical protein